ncbi:MAG: sulfate/thiosulfate transport system ATP-binding protein, partial [Pseudonocardiales bacterium]|nr:sulfate/thiosulfate transport system ATP-binding protein [Pseudonocardiales bacterium]
ADELVVINYGRVEQVGSPDDLYDKPANEFVMGFLGPVTRLGDRLVRPHDIEVFAVPVDDGVVGEVIRLQRIGFEVRADLRAGADEVRVQLTRGQAETLALGVGSTVWLRSAPLAATLSVPA